MPLFKIQHRRDTAKNWAAQNPILLDGEIGIIVDAGPNSVAWRVGNGRSHWNDLPIVSGPRGEKGDPSPLSDAIDSQDSTVGASSKAVKTLYDVLKRPATAITLGDSYVATGVEVQNGVKDASRGGAPAFVDVADLPQAKNGIGLGRFDQTNDFTVMHSPNGQLGLYIHDNGLWGVWDDASKADCPLPLTRGGTASRTPYDARLALNVPAWPSNDGPGIFGTIFFPSNTAATIPAGGVYAYWCFCRSADGSQRFENVFSGIGAGGSIVGDGVTWGQEKWLCYWGFI